MKVKRFEDLQIWERSRKLTKLIYGITSSHKFVRDRALKDQLTRASVSVMSNIAEGFDSGTKAEFARFLSMSRRSISEIQSQLYAALDQEYVVKNEFESLYNEAEEIRRMITGFIKYLRGIK